MFRVYILRCADSSYYTGLPTILKGASASIGPENARFFAATRCPVELAWSQECVTRKDVLPPELQIRGWSRAKKEAMMRVDWMQFSRLVKSKSAHPSTGSGRTDLHFLREAES